MNFPRLSRRARRSRRPLAPLASLSLSLLLVASAVPFGASAQQTDPDSQTLAADARSQKGPVAEFVPGAALVRFRSEAAADSAGRAATVKVGRASSFGLILDDGAGVGGSVTARFRHVDDSDRFGGSDIVPGLRLAELSTASPAQTLDAIAALNSRPDVLYAEPDYIWRAKATPNDPRYSEQYGLERISAPAAWDTTTGSKSVVVAVIDEGVDLKHPDLADNAWVNPGEVADDGLDNDNNGFIDDVHGWDFHNGDKTTFDSADGDDHGTHVAGTIGAKGNNGVGVVGVNWNVSLMSVKVLGPTNGSVSKIIAGYNYVRMMKQRGVNVRVTNNSYGGPGNSQSALAAINALNAEGILFVAAAGNDSRDNFSYPDFPANYNAPNVLAVASTNTLSPEGISAFSNFSSRLVSMGAPGSQILSTIPNNAYAKFSGTSMATPHVAGAAALLLSVAPNIAVANLRGALAFSGDILPALTDKTTTGRRLNVAAALQSAVESDATAPAVTSLSVPAQSGRTVTVQFNAPGDDGFSGTAADYDFYFVNPSTGLRILMPTSATPVAGGTAQGVNVDVPLRNFSGTIELVAYDNRGNASTSSVAVSVPVNAGSDPYVVTPSVAEALSTGGAALALTGDDKYLKNHPLPFAFPFFGTQRTTLTVSTNGALYFSTPPLRDDGDADDADSSVAALQGQVMIAGLWDDLEIDATKRADAGIFVVQPDASRVIFRWQATTFPTPLTNNTTRGVNPVNFEIELRADGTVITRYGDGNQKVVPVVGISGGEPSAYHISTHSSENTLKDLTNAQTITFAPRGAQAPPPPAATVQFNTSGFAASEAANQAVLTVTRSGDSQSAGSVQVRTVDNNAAVRCDDTTTLPGVAFSRCDYATTIRTLDFAPGETSKTFSVPLINDAHPEGAETVQIALSNPTGGVTLGAQTTMTLTITSDDGTNAVNPLDGPPHDFFVRQQYLDFLSREPDDGGRAAWLNVLNGCANAFNHDPTAPAAGCDRNQVSMGFFRSPEFELKGLYVFRFYKLAFGLRPEYAEIISDMSFVAGNTGDEVFARKAELAAQFTARPAFAAVYGAMSNDAFVATLLGRYGLTQITTPDPANPDGVATQPGNPNSPRVVTKVTLTQAELVSRLTAGTLTRAQVFRAVADSDQVGAAEFDQAFVAMQYYGYLRRTPDAPGFNAWLNYLATHPGDYYTMVNGFVYSPEYRLRFGKE